MADQLAHLELALAWGPAFVTHGHGSGLFEKAL
jgi:hypothetical protein